MKTTRERIEHVEKKRKLIMKGGGDERIAKQHASGKLTARERLDALYDPNTFMENGVFVHSGASPTGDIKLPADGVVVGAGLVDGRPVCSYAQDFTVAGGSVGGAHGKKIVAIMENAQKVGAPVVCFNDSGGARIQEGVEALSAYGRIFFQNVNISGVVPQIAVIAGPCAGGAAYSPALCDFQVMVDKTANMFITGPDVIKTVTGEVVTAAELGGASAHMQKAGNIHFIAHDDKDAVAIVRELLSYLPSNNLSDPPHHLNEPIVAPDDAEIAAIMPDSPQQPYDVRKILMRLLDNGKFLEVQEHFAPNIVVGFGRLSGVVVGIVANQPMHLAGCLDINSSCKAARFIRTCNVFNIPILSFVDVPGFLPGVNQEHNGIIRHGAKMLFAFSATTTPKITIILRKAYGGAYLAMCSKDLRADRVIAWPTAEIAVMGADGAINIIYKKDLEAAEDKKAKRAELTDRYREETASPFVAAARGFVDDVIDPATTRRHLCVQLRMLLTKRELRPAKKHGNIPL